MSASLRQKRLLRTLAYGGVPVGIVLCVTGGLYYHGEQGWPVLFVPLGCLVSNLSAWRLSEKPLFQFLAEGHE